MKKIFLSFIIIFFVKGVFGQSDVAKLVAVKSPFTYSVAAYFSGIIEDSLAKHYVPSATSPVGNMTTLFARRNKSGVEIVWQPAIKENKTVFVIEKKMPTGWKIIAYIPCSSYTDDLIPEAYSYIDVKPGTGVSDYRVTEKNEDGNIRNSQMVSLMTGHKPDMQARMSGTRLLLAFANDGEREIKVFDEKGQLLQDAKNIVGKKADIVVQSSSMLFVAAREVNTGLVSTTRISK